MKKKNQKKHRHIWQNNGGGTAVTSKKRYPSDQTFHCLNGNCQASLCVYSTADWRYKKLDNYLDEKDILTIPVSALKKLRGVGKVVIDRNGA